MRIYNLRFYLDYLRKSSLELSRVTTKGPRNQWDVEVRPKMCNLIDCPDSMTTLTIFRELELWQELPKDCRCDVINCTKSWNFYPQSPSISKHKLLLFVGIRPRSQKPIPLALRTLVNLLTRRIYKICSSDHRIVWKYAKPPLIMAVHQQHLLTVLRVVIAPWVLIDPTGLVCAVHLSPHKCTMHHMILPWEP